MNFWYIEHDGVGVEDDFDAKYELIQAYQMVTEGISLLLKYL